MPQPNTTCATCNKQIYRLPCIMKLYKVHYCDRDCQINFRYSWVGYAVQMAGTISRQEIAAHIGIPFNTFKMWVRDFLKVGIHLKHSKRKIPEKVKPVKVKAAPKPKEPKYTQSMRKKRQEPRKMPTRVIDESQYKYIKLNSKTYVLRKTAS